MSEKHKRIEEIEATPTVDRDISWMYFNRRILLEAQRPEVPVLERLGFLGIYSNNLDEFFRVRMASLARASEGRGEVSAESARKALATFAEISDLDSDYSLQFEQAMAEVRGARLKEGIRIIDETSLDEAQKHAVRCLFRSKVSGYVAPMWLKHLEGFSRETDSRIYLGVELKGPGRSDQYAVIQLPDAECGRFVEMPDGEGGDRCVMYLDDVLRFCLPMIFPGMGFTEFNAYSFKFTKDAEMELDNDSSAGPMQKIARGVRSRRNGAALRVIYDAAMPQGLLKALMRKLKLDRLDTVKPSGRYHNHKDLMAFPTLGRTDLRYPAWKPAVPEELKSGESLLQVVSSKDRFVHVPYQTFDYVVRLLQEAAVSHHVKSIQMTLYRVARDSKIIKALICAARNGKKVTAVVELLARFDEQSNIDWAKKMQEAGVKVIFGVEGLKVHSKLALIGMKQGSDIAVIGSGNFHEGNAKAYTDYFLMTADRAIVRDVKEVFRFIENPSTLPKLKHLLMSPVNMRQRFEALVEREINHHRKGRPAGIRIKINHITDPGMVRLLERAVAEGVPVQIAVRGNFAMAPGLMPVGTPIYASGIIDRYLEHSRIFCFANGGEEEVFMGSADWMPRNLDHRVEVITPVLDPEAKADCIATVEAALRDNTHAHRCDGTGHDALADGIEPTGNRPGEKFRSQQWLHDKYSTKSNS